MAEYGADIGLVGTFTVTAPGTQGQELPNDPSASRYKVRACVEAQSDKIRLMVANISLPEQSLQKEAEPLICLHRPTIPLPDHHGVLAVFLKRFLKMAVTLRWLVRYLWHVEMPQSRGSSRRAYRRRSISMNRLARFHRSRSQLYEVWRSALVVVESRSFYRRECRPMHKTSMLQLRYIALYV